MSQYIEKPRYVCALGGFETVLGISRAVPILHAGPGCGAKLSGGIGTLNGCQGSSQYSPHSLPSTNFGEAEVIFGGGGKLQETIENALKVFDADLFVVLTGCISEIVGDDVGEVVSHFSDSEKPVIFAQTAGFKGSNLTGHEMVLDAITEQLLRPTGIVNSRQVNVWSSVPYFNPFWYGDLQEIARLLTALGLEPNILYGPNGGIEGLRKIPSAALNLLVSPWVGLRNVRKLQEKFGTLYLHIPVLPIGPTETGSFIRKVASYAKVDKNLAEELIRKSERDYYFYIERAADELLKTRLLPKRFITVADSHYSLGITKFLVNDMGLLPETQYITENPPLEFRELISGEFRALEEGLSAPTEYVTSSGDAQERIKQQSFITKPFILGSGWEKTFSANFGTISLSLSAPLLDRMVLNRTYLGYTGALTLLEDICSPILSSYQ